MSYQPRRACVQHNIVLRGLRFHLYEWQGLGPPLILLHGWGDSGETYQFLVDELRSERRCLALDMRGFGRSDWPQEGYWFPNYLADLDALLEHIAPNEPVDLVGHSMGGNVAMLYAGIRPERVRRLINLEGFGLPRTDPKQAPRRYREWLDEVRAGPQAYAEHGSFARFEELLRKRNPLTSPERIAFIASAWARETSSGRVVPRADPRHKWVNAVLYRREEAESCWRNITAPVLLIGGDQSEVAQRSGAPQEFAEFVAMLRDVQVETVAGAGHMLHHEQPEKVAQHIEQFLAR
ncbi:MAG: alpha/beta hydrolase [Steroidobacteraceae bacterium]